MNNFIYVVTITMAGHTVCSNGAYSTREEAVVAGEDGVKAVARNQAINEGDLHFDILPVVNYLQPQPA